MAVSHECCHKDTYLPLHIKAMKYLRNMYTGEFLRRPPAEQRTFSENISLLIPPPMDEICEKTATKTITNY